jgi:hypothetical protein
MAGPTAVSVLVPHLPEREIDFANVRETVAAYLETTGLTFEVLTFEDCEYGAALRKGVSDATGAVIVVIDAELPYPVRAIGDAVALIDSGAADVIFATTDPHHRHNPLLKSFLVPLLPNATLRCPSLRNSSSGKRS